MAATKDGARYDRITLHRWQGYWIATDEQRDISSSPMDTRKGALDDLDEVVALDEGDIGPSESSNRTAERSRRDFKNGDFVPLEDV